MSSESTDKEVDERFSIVKRLYGDRLTTEQLDEVRKGVVGIVEAAEALRAVKLENGDEPFSVFVPYRKEG
jgi:hypothetical protein